MEKLAFDVCCVTGDRHPDFLYEHLSARQLLDWELYSKQYGHRDDLNFAMITATLANQHRQKGKPPISPQQVMPYLQQDQADKKARIIGAMKAAKMKAEAAKKHAK